MAIFSLDQVLEILIEWECSLNDFYEVLEQNVKRESSKKIISLLKREQEKTMGVIKAIDLNDYKNVEFDKNLPDYKSDKLFPEYTINEESGPGEILGKVFDFEEELLEMYKHIAHIVVYQKSKDVFNMLTQFKLGQVKRIGSYMDGLDIVESSDPVS